MAYRESLPSEAADLFTLLGSEEFIVLFGARNIIACIRIGWLHLRYRKRVSAFVVHKRVAGVGAGSDVVDAADFRGEVFYLGIEIAFWAIYIVVAIDQTPLGIVEASGRCRPTRHRLTPDRLNV